MSGSAVAAGLRATSAHERRGGRELGGSVASRLVFGASVNHFEEMG